MITPAREIAEKATEQYTQTARKGPQNELLFDAMTRWVEETDPDFAT